MMHIELNLKPEIERQLIEIVGKKFSGSYERFIENALPETGNVLSQLGGIAEKLEINDLAENHDEYLYGKQK